MSEFKREDRYIVLKRKDAAQLPQLMQRQLSDICAHIGAIRRSATKEPLHCVVVESDWPEYETVWKMIEDRMAGRAPIVEQQQTPAIGGGYWAKAENGAVKFEELNRRAPSAEQQRQEPVATVRRFHADRIAVKGLPGFENLPNGTKLYTHQQPQVQGDTVPMPQNADQAQMMANVGIAWLEANAPERLKQPQGKPVAAPLQWSGHLKPDDQVSYDHIIGSTPFGRILITWKSWKDDWSLIIDEHPIESARGCYAGGTIEGAIETAEQKYLEALRGAVIEQPRAAVPDEYEILAIFKRAGLEIELGRTYSVRGQIAHLLEGARAIAAAPALSGDAQGGEG